MLELTDKEKAIMKSLAKKVAHTLHDDPRITMLDWDKFKIDWYMEDDRCGRYAYIFLMFQPMISEDLFSFEPSPEVEYLKNALRNIDISFGKTGGTTSIRPYLMAYHDFCGNYTGNQAIKISIKLI